MEEYIEDVEVKKEENNTYGVVGFILSLIGVLISCCYGTGIVFSIPGLILSILQIKKKKDGLSIAGLVLGIIGIVLSIIIIISFIVIFNDPEFQSLYNSILDEATTTEL